MEGSAMMMSLVMFVDDITNVPKSSAFQFCIIGVRGAVR